MNYFKILLGLVLAAGSAHAGILMGPSTKIDPVQQGIESDIQRILDVNQNHVELIKWETKEADLLQSGFTPSLLGVVIKRDGITEDKAFYGMVYEDLGQSGSLVISRGYSKKLKRWCLASYSDTHECFCFQWLEDVIRGELYVHYEFVSRAEGYHVVITKFGITEQIMHWKDQVGISSSGGL